jgi:fructose-bisphosphate aldolase class 1
MTRKTYIELAKDLGRILSDNDGDTVVAWQIIHSMCRAMQQDNDKFDRSRFETAVKAAMES